MIKAKQENTIPSFTWKKSSSVEGKNPQDNFDQIKYNKWRLQYSSLYPKLEFSTYWEIHQ